MLRFKRNKILIFVLSLLIVMVNVPLITLAATGNQGYAIYRDGAFGNFNWHAGLMDRPSTSYYIPVTHIMSGSGEGVTLATWDDFMDDTSNIFKGVYRPNASISSIGRDNVVSMGRKLITEDLGYTPLFQVEHSVIDSNAWVMPNDIWLIRCDGVVEYSYEYLGYRIYGSDSLWNISRGGSTRMNHHSGIAITPSKQAQNNMTLVQNAKP